LCLGTKEKLLTNELVGIGDMELFLGVALKELSI
jgi:hypothetical protein